MIHFLKIKNFGPVLKEAVLNLEIAEKNESEAYEVKMPDGRRLLKLAYIYGANASGKTTILKAFEFLRQLLFFPVSEKSQQLNFEPFLFNKAPYKKPSSFQLSFYAKGTRYVYTVQFNKQSILEEKLVFYQSAKPTELFHRTTDQQKRLTKIEFGSKLKIPVREKDLLESNTLHNNTVIGGYVKTNVDIPELESLYSYLNRFLLGMITSADNLVELTATLIHVDSRAEGWINEFLHKADSQIATVRAHNEFESVPIEPFSLMPGRSFLNRSRLTRNLLSIKTEPSIKLSSERKFYGGGPVERKVEVVHRIKDIDYTLPLRSESNGTKHYLGLGGALYLLLLGSHMLCIDELENSLHPDLMQYFLQAFLVNSRASQLLITTHNLSLMENEDFIRKDALWFTEKEDDGSVRLYSASDFDSSTLRKGASVINAYRAGRLGGKPNLGSPYLTKD